MALSAGAEEVMVDAIAAQVGGSIVLVSEVLEASSLVEAEMAKVGASAEEVSQVRADILERLIERRMIEEVIYRAELGASDQEINRAIGTIAEENGLTFDELKESVEAQGLPFEEYHKKIRGEIELSKVLNVMVNSQVNFDESDVRVLYEKRFSDQPTGGTEVHLRQLLITVREDRPLSQSCAVARKALRRIQSGALFVQVASEVSDMNPGQGGNVGWVHMDTMAAWMIPAVKKLNAGETSSLIEQPFGCVALYLEERRTFEPIGYETVRQALLSDLFDSRLDDEYSRWIDELRADTYIDRKGAFLLK